VNKIRIIMIPTDPGTEELGKDVDSSGDLGADRSLGG
jgi:hypothetical protein